MSELHLRIGDPLRPYIRDAIDEAVARVYAQRGFNPPERPSGFLDEGERATWERWREAQTPQQGED